LPENGRKMNTDVGIRILEERKERKEREKQRLRDKDIHK
jgi:hypothetical protein